MKVKKVKVGDKEYAELDSNGLPVYVHDDGREAGFDAPGTLSRISGLNREAQTHREALEQAQGKLKLFDGIEDPEAARAALGTVGNLKAGDLKTAAEVEAIKEAARKAAETQVQDTARQSAQRLADLEKERDTFRDGLYNEKVGGAFLRSKFITDRVTIHPEAVRSIFGNHFKVEDGKLVPYGHDGNKIYSKTRGGEVADFEEGIEHLVDTYAHKGSILKGTGASGSGTPHAANPGQQGNGKPTMTRQQYEGLAPAAKGEAARSHQIVDAA